ncbi:MAG: ThiF family adenylyltransferase [Planctomycetota bacterium]|nr:MAG: ThiF family adenylyltransferase [Planctomycetota bacterium]
MGRRAGPSRTHRPTGALYGAVQRAPHLRAGDHRQHAAGAARLQRRRRPPRGRGDRSQRRDPDVANHRTCLEGPLVNDRGRTPAQGRQISVDDAAAAPGDRFDRQRRIAGWNQQRLRNAHVLVVGAGAIGNEVLLKLAMLGFGEITLCDMDRIEHSNLARTPLFRPGDVGRHKVEVAAERIAAIDPELRVHPVVGPFETSIGTGTIAACDLVLGCLDSLTARLAVNRRCLLARTPWIDAGIDDRAASVLVIRPEQGGCYECALDPVAHTRIARRYSCADKLLAAPEQGIAPTVATIAGLAANLQVQLALALLHDGSETAPDSPFAAPAGGFRLTVSAHPWRLRTTRRERSDLCTAHDETAESPTPLPTGTHDSARALAAAIEARLGWRPGTVFLDEPIVERLACAACDESGWVGVRRDDFPASEAACPRCGRRRSATLARSVATDGPLAHTPLARLGVPPRAWLTVADEHRSTRVELAG